MYYLLLLIKFLDFVNKATTPVIPHKSPETKQYEGKVLEIAKGEGKHDAAEEGSSSQNGDNAVKQSGIIVGANTPDQPRAEGSSSELQSIRPGIAGDVKFGGSGSVPNLPWVSTTGSGPKGRTISGVTYRFSSTQIRIVCACHGSHMSPEEFVQHASEDQQTNQEMATGVALQSSNSAASAQS